MLVHQSWASEATEGAGVPSVKITNRTVFNVRISGTCHSGIKLGLDGVLSTLQADGGFSAISGEWLLTGSASSFFVQRTIISGTLEVDPGTGFLQLNADRIYDNQKATQGIKTTEIFFEIADDGVGTTILDTATMTFLSEQGDL